MASAVGRIERKIRLLILPEDFFKIRQFQIPDLIYSGGTNSLGFLIVQVSKWHSDTPQLVGLYGTQTHPTQ